jgi:uncharacterized protein
MMARVLNEQPGSVGCRSVSEVVEEETFPTRILPPVDDSNRHFWTGGAVGELRILRCQDCRHWIHPPAASCSRCGGTHIAAETTSGTGSVFTFTVNHHPFSPTVPVPYIIAIVELDDEPGLRFTTNIVHCEPEDVTIGMAVRVLFERHDDVFVPVFEPTAAPIAAG